MQELDITTKFHPDINNLVEHLENALNGEPTGYLEEVLEMGFGEDLNRSLLSPGKYAWVEALASDGTFLGLAALKWGVSDGSEVIDTVNWILPNGGFANPIFIAIIEEVKEVARERSVGVRLLKDSYLERVLDWSPEELGLQESGVWGLFPSYTWYPECIQSVLELPEGSEVSDEEIEEALNTILLSYEEEFHPTLEILTAKEVVELFSKEEYRGTPMERIGSSVKHNLSRVKNYDTRMILATYEGDFYGFMIFEEKDLRDVDTALPLKRIKGKKPKSNLVSYFIPPFNEEKAYNTAKDMINRAREMSASEGLSLTVMVPEADEIMNEILEEDFYEIGRETTSGCSVAMLHGGKVAYEAVPAFKSKIAWQIIEGIPEDYQQGKIQIDVRLMGDN